MRTVRGRSEMSIHELFERCFADLHDLYPEDVKAFRMQNGSYSKAKIATSFRYFKAGFEANQGEKMQVLGYLGQEYAKPMTVDDQLYLHPTPTEWETVPVFVKDCDALNKGME